jgi:nitroreductase
MDTLNKLITDRWSPVAFDSRKVEFETLHLLFEAAKWAPSGRNSQPWRFVFATKDMPDYKLFLSPAQRSQPGMGENGPFAGASPGPGDFHLQEQAQPAGLL